MLLLLQAQDESRAAPAGQAAADPSYVLLPGGDARMPLVGLGTYKLASAEAVRIALAGGSRGCGSMGCGTASFSKREQREYV